MPKTDIVVLARAGSIHHAAGLISHFGERVVVEGDFLPGSVLRHDPAIVVTFDEHSADLGLCIGEARRHGIATLQAMDGVLEWRRTWQCPTSLQSRPLNQPALAHKIACLGRTDARLLESWGNIGACEVIGLPRLDALSSARPPLRTSSIRTRNLRLLVMTAKTPGFTPEQIDTTCRSLEDLKTVLASRSDIDVVWRVTQDLHRRLDVRNTLGNVLSTELHDLLRTVDAVITTPSTAMLEGMLAGLPVALLDYHNCPHYVSAAWCVSSRDHIQPVLEELRDAPLRKMLYQEYCLSEALAFETPALPRMTSLIQEMVRIRGESVASGAELRFPERIAGAASDVGPGLSRAFDLRALYPERDVFGDRDVAHLQGELEAALGTIEILQGKVERLTRRLHSIPGYLLGVRVLNHLRGGIRTHPAGTRHN